MRPREEIEKDTEWGRSSADDSEILNHDTKLQIEVLLDIRDLLIGLEKHGPD
jgi:hypothetical protein